MKFFYISLIFCTLAFIIQLNLTKKYKCMSFTKLSTAAVVLGTLRVITVLIWNRLIIVKHALNYPFHCHKKQTLGQLPSGIQSDIFIHM